MLSLGRYLIVCIICYLRSGFAVSHRESHECDSFYPPILFQTYLYSTTDQKNYRFIKPLKKFFRDKKTRQSFTFLVINTVSVFFCICFVFFYTNFIFVLYQVDIVLYLLHIVLYRLYIALYELQVVLYELYIVLYRFYIVFYLL